MKASSRRASRNKRLSQFGLIAVGVLVVAMLLPSIFSTLASVVMAPAHMVRVWLSESSDSLPQYVRERSELIDELEAAQQQLSQKSESSLTIARLQNETNSLRSLLGDTPEERLLSTVLARPDNLPYDVIQLDKGEEDGVLYGAPVFVAGDQLVGVISHVKKSYSFATLVTAPGFRSTSYIVGPNIYTPASGIGGGLLRVQVPQGIDLEPGNLVVLPAVDSGMFGEIFLVETIPTRPEQYGYVESGIPIQSLRFVTIGRSPIEEQSFEAAQETIESVKEGLLEVPVPAGVLVDTIATSTPTSTEAINETESQ